MSKQNEWTSIPLAHDMHNHLHDRLTLVLEDHMGTCQTGGLSLTDTVSIMMSAVLFETALCASLLNLSDKEFISLCLTAYRKIDTPTIKKEMVQ